MRGDVSHQGHQAGATELSGSSHRLRWSKLPTNTWTKTPAVQRGKRQHSPLFLLPQWNHQELVCKIIPHSKMCNVVVLHTSVYLQMAAVHSANSLCWTYGHFFLLLSKKCIWLQHNSKPEFEAMHLLLLNLNLLLLFTTCRGRNALLRWTGCPPQGLPSALPASL